MSDTKQEDQGPKPRNSRKKAAKQEFKALNNDAGQKIETQIKNNRKVNVNSRKNKISINHLLNYQLYRDLPEYQQNQRNRRNSGNNGSNSARNRRQRLHLHGMRFINVNYKFVVDYRQSYTAQQMDPNVPVDTENILRIIVPRGNACPICLSEDLVAPRMITSCGHILCLTCLLSLLESEVPVHKKQESKVIVEKYRDCPLCGSIIRKHDVKPVQVDYVDEQFEIPKVQNEVPLTLMVRKPGQIVPLPILASSFGVTFDVFPWASDIDLDVAQCLRFFKGNLEYLLSMYKKEKLEIEAAYEIDKELYQDDGRFVKLALANIDEDIAKWTLKFSDALEKTSSSKSNGDSNGKNGSSFYFYQTGFKSWTTYVLAPLDMKVLKSSNNQDYAQLPDTVSARVENIRYEELTEETVTTKYKYLSHLPQGTLIGFLECNWQNNDYISKETWNTFRNDLQLRTKQSQKRAQMEEKNRLRAIIDDEKRVREYIERENNGEPEYSYDPESWIHSGSLGSLTITDHREMPALVSSHSQVAANNDNFEDEKPAMQKTVWGTQIPKAEVKDLDEDANWDAEEMIRRAREEIERTEGQKGKKKKKKKIVLLSSGSVW